MVDLDGNDHRELPRPATEGDGGSGLGLMFSVLGPLSIRGGGDEIVLARSKPVLILGSLLLHANTLVSYRYLRTVLWEDEPPAGGAAAVHSAVLRLRKLLAKYGFSGGGRDVIETFPGGYRITADATMLDLIAFRVGVAEARAAGDPAVEVGLLRSALDLWAGEPLVSLDSPVLRDSCAALTEERIDAVTRCNELELTGPDCRSLIPGLRVWTREYPGNELLAAQLIEALYRSGRQNEALAEFERVRHHMSENFGLDPGHRLRRLHLSIVHGDELGRAPAAEGRVELPAASAESAFPLDIPDFCGRQDELDFLAERIDNGSVVVVSGAPGVGKTAFAVHLSWQVRSRFPEAHFVPAGAEGFGRPPASGLVIMDGARDVDQVQRALDGSRRSAIIVTSRFSLAQLAVTTGAALCRLGPLARRESKRFLTAVLGQGRVDAEADAADELAALCGDHPMALRLAATKLSLRREHRLSSLVESVRAGGATVLEIGCRSQGSVSARLADYERSLGIECAGALRALAHQTSQPLTLDECARALGEPEQRAVAIVDRLVDASAVVHDERGCYWIPDFLRTYLCASGDLASSSDGPEPRLAGQSKPSVINGDGQAS